MARIDTKFGKSLTLEQFAKMNNSKDLRIRPAYEGTGADKRPLCFDGTNIQKRTVIDDANNTVGWVSQKVCEALQNGTHVKGTPVNIVVNEATDGSGVCFFTLSYQSNAAEAVSVDDLL